MKKIPDLPTSARNLTPRENVLSTMGARCGQCGYDAHTAPLVIRAEGLTQNRKKVNYHHYWMQVAGLAMTQPSAIEILCRNCLAIEMDQAKNPVSLVPVVYVYSTDLPEDTILKRQLWLDELPEPKIVYILTGSYGYRYFGNKKQGSEYKIVELNHEEMSELRSILVGSKTDLIDNRLHKVVNGDLVLVQ